MSGLQAAGTIPPPPPPLDEMLSCFCMRFDMMRSLFGRLHYIMAANIIIIIICSSQRKPILFFIHGHTTKRVRATETKRRRRRKISKVWHSVNYYFSLGDNNRRVANGNYFDFRKVKDAVRGTESARRWIHLCSWRKSNEKMTDLQSGDYIL